MSLQTALAQMSNSMRSLCDKGEGLLESMFGLALIGMAARVADPNDVQFPTQGEVLTACAVLTAQAKNWRVRCIDDYAKVEARVLYRAFREFWTKEQIARMAVEEQLQIARILDAGAPDFVRRMRQERRNLTPRRSASDPLAYLMTVGNDREDRTPLQKRVIALRNAMLTAARGEINTRYLCGRVRMLIHWDGIDLEPDLRDAILRCLDTKEVERPFRDAAVTNAAVRSAVVLLKGQGIDADEIHVHAPDGPEHIGPYTYADMVEFLRTGARPYLLTAAEHRFVLLATKELRAAESEDDADALASLAITIAVRSEAMVTEAARELAFRLLHAYGVDTSSRTFLDLFKPEMAGTIANAFREREDFVSSF